MSKRNISLIYQILLEMEISAIWKGFGKADRLLPTRTFSNDRYPIDKKINGYSKMGLLMDVLDIFDGKPKYDVVTCSYFGPLFTFRVRRCAFVGKLVQKFICHHIHSDNVDELWFTFIGHPLWFSVAEFGEITGLSCGPFPSSQEI